MLEETEEKLKNSLVVPNSTADCCHRARYEILRKSNDEKRGDLKRTKKWWEKTIAFGVPILIKIVTLTPICVEDYNISFTILR